MSENNKDKLKNHSFDGIEEYDNQLPKWWLATFVITVVFGLAYWFYYHVYQLGPNQEQELQQAIVENSQQSKKDDIKSGDSLSEEVLKLKSDPQALAQAADVFKQNCTACHGEQAQGVIGPNLTDNAWINGGTIEALHNTIVKGVSDKGMPAWGPVLGEEKIEKLIAYILSLQGSNPANAKAAEGKPL